MTTGHQLATIYIEVSDLIQAAGWVDHAGAEDCGTHQLASSALS